MTPNYLTPLPFPKPLPDTLKEWESWGIVVNHFLFPVLSEVTIDTHYQAAYSGLITTIRQGEKGPGRWKGTVNWEQIRPEDGEKLSPQKFLG